MSAPNYFTQKLFEQDVANTREYAEYGDNYSSTTATSYAFVCIRDSGTWVGCRVYSINDSTWMLMWEGTKRHLMVPKRILGNGSADQLAETLKNYILPSMNPGLDTDYILTAGMELPTMLVFILYLHHHADDFYKKNDYSCFYIPLYVNVEPFRLKIIHQEYL